MTKARLLVLLVKGFLILPRLSLTHVHKIVLTCTNWRKLPMKRVLFSIIVCTALVLNLFISGVAAAKPMFNLPFLAGASGTEALPAEELTQLLETKVLPEIESLLTPEQREQFIMALADGKSLRKAFKAMTLTPDQKAELAAYLKSSMYGKGVLASLTPEQKKQFFLKKAEAFTPTADEIAEQIVGKMPLAKDTGNVEPQALTDKIAEKLKMFMGKGTGIKPTPEEIGQKIVDRKKFGQSMNPMKAKPVGTPTPEEIGERVTGKIKAAQEMAKQKAAEIPSADEIGEKISEQMKVLKSKIEDAAS